MLRTVFIVEVCVDEESKQYVVAALSVAEKKQTTMVGPSLRLLLPRLKKLLFQRDQMMRRYPLPEESRIISPNKSGNVLVLPT